MRRLAGTAENDGIFSSRHLLPVGLLLLLLFPVSQVGMTADLAGNGALALNGDGDHITMGPAPGLNTSRFTLETWFRWDGIGQVATTGTHGIRAYPLITKGRDEADGDPRDLNYFLGIQASGGVLVADFEEHAGGSRPGMNHPVEGRTVVVPGLMHHAAATYDGKCWQLYLDGRPETDGTHCPAQPPNYESTQHFALGTAMDSRGQARGYFGGVLDEVRIWSRALPGDEIRTNMRRPAPLSMIGLVGWYRFDENRGDRILDATSPGERGRIFGPRRITDTLLRQTSAVGDVIISGFSASINDAEWIELFNTSNQTISLDDMTLVTRMDLDPVDDVLDDDWAMAADLTGQSIAPYSFFLIGEANVSPTPDLTTTIDLSTGEMGSAERALSLELTIGGLQMDYVLYGRHDGSDSGAVPAGDIPFGGNGTPTVPRDEVIRTVSGTGTSFTEGVTQRVSAEDLHAGHAVDGYYKDEDLLPGSFAAGVWTSAHATSGGNAPRNASSTAVPSPTCALDSDCDDGDACNGTETCNTQTEQCEAGTPIDCGSLICDPSDGACVDCLIDADCANGDACDGIETCDLGSCLPDVPPDCDDSLVCTADSCDPASGCVHADDCPAGEFCDPGTGGCETLPALPPLPILAGDEWRYFRGQSEPITDWNTVGFDDSTWELGPTGFGYGDGDDATLLDASNPPAMQGAYVSLYIRRGFALETPGSVYALRLTIDYDDAYVCYLNGIEIARSSNIAGNPPTYDATASAGHEASAGSGGLPPESTDVSAGLLVSGTNVLACQGHNADSTSSDFSLIPLLQQTVPPNAPPDPPSNETPADQATGIEANPQLCVDVSDFEGEPLEVQFFGRGLTEALADDFTIIVLPDTQLYSQTYPSVFQSQTQWILDNQDALNIAFVTHVGDIVNVAGIEQQWLNADAALSLLDPAGNEELMPYGLAVGNHDQPSTLFNVHFGLNRFCPDSICRSYYGGNYGTTNDNNYQLFSAGGMDFVIIHLEFDLSSSASSPGPDDGSHTWDVMNWAEGVLATYSDRRAIISSHFILDTWNLTGDFPPRSIQGQRLYNWFKDNENVFLMVCGHYWQAARRSDPTIAGDANQDGKCDASGTGCIDAVVADYQNLASGGNGWLRIMTFSPNNDTIRVRTYSTTLDAYIEECDYSDPVNCSCSLVDNRWVCGPACNCVTHPDHAQAITQNDFYLDYDMQGGPSFIQIGATLTDVASGSRVCVDWPGRMPGTDYEWYVDVDDSTHLTRGPRWLFTSNGSCADDAECNDGLFCNGTESCDVGGSDTCLPGLDPCPGQLCDDASDTCVDCTENSECDDGDACTTDTCDVGFCLSTPLDCSDGNDCTTDSCTDGVCGHLYAPTAGCCVDDADCYDTDSCTRDSCDAGVCSNEEVCCNDDADCDDADACTDDVCSESSILDVVDIVGNDVSVSCDPATALSFDSSSPYFGFTANMLSWTHTYSIPSGAITSASLTFDAGDLDSGVLQLRASDGTLIGTVAGGENGAPGPFVCPWEWDAAGNDVVLTIPPSLYPDLMDGDFSVQTLLESGSVGSYGTNRAMLTIDVHHAECTSTPLDCDDGSACTTDSCNPLSGCVNDVTASIGDPCDDGIGCTVGDACNASGACVPGLPDDASCDDLDTCTADACDPFDPASDPFTGCVSTLTPGTPCDDGDACTTNDQCGPSNIRSLIGTDTDPLFPGGPCPLETSLTGTLGVPSSWPGFTTEMVNWTHNYTPISAPILGATLTIDIGDADTGQLDVRAADGTSIGTLSGGDNGAPGPFVCPWEWDGQPDGNDIVLTIPPSLYPDLSDGSFFVETISIAGVGAYGINRAVLDVEVGGSCGGAPLDCDDGNACNGPETCDPLTGCQAGTEPPDCDDFNACTDDSCDPVAGCLHVPNDANSCDDSDVCNGSEVCAAGACVPGTTLICDDGDACNGAETCDPALGCQPGTGNDCDDGNVCTIDGCAAGSCSYTSSGQCGIGGTVRYYRDDGAAAEPSTKTVPNVEIDATDDGVAEQITDGGGSYVLPDLYGSYIVTTLDKYGDPRISDPHDAITSFDASAIARSVVNQITLSTHQGLAADVSGNGQVTSFDAAKIAQYAVAQIDHFDVADASGSDWLFYRCDRYDGASDHDCVAPVYTHSPLTGSVSDDFYAILYGDVTGNWLAPVPPGRSTATGSEAEARERDRQQAATLKAHPALARPRPDELGPARLWVSGPTGVVPAGKQWTATLNLSDADGITAIDLGLEYDAGRVSILAVETADLAAGLVLTGNDLGDRYLVSLFGVLPMEGNGAIVTVTLEARAAIRAADALKITAEANEGRIKLLVAPRPEELERPALEVQKRKRAASAPR